jgi:hypothetical protein
VTGAPLLAVSGAAGLKRATGPFPIWHSLAAYLLIVLVVAVSLLLRRDLDVLPRAVLLAVTALDAAALMLSVTATVIVWLVVAVVVVAVLQGRLLQAVGLLAVTAGLVGVLFAGTINARIAEQSRSSAVALHDGRQQLVPQTIAYRFAVWNRDYVPLLGRAVPFGVANELPESAVFQHAENEYILLALRGGVLLLLGAITAMLVLGRDLHRSARRHTGLTGVTAGAMLGAVAFLPLAAMIWPYLTNAGFPQAFFALTGAAAGPALLVRRREQL